MMTAARAFEVLHRAAVRSSVSQEVADAIMVVTEHTTRLEQALNLIANGVESALANKPDNALVRRK